MDYQVDLDAFHGPLDLLLFLVKREEIDVLDIPIARITEQFRAYIDVLQVIDVEHAGDFLVMAGTLMEIKSRMLLPRPEEHEAEEEDPRLDLVRQLIEYKKFKEAASLLEARAEQQSCRLPRRPSPHVASDPIHQPLRQAELWDLVSAFGRLMRETLNQQPEHLVLDHTPQHVHVEEVLRLLQEGQSLPFSALFTPPHNRARLVGLFLAILELIKNNALIAEQDDLFSEIRLTRPPKSVEM